MEDIKADDDEREPENTKLMAWQITILVGIGMALVALGIILFPLRWPIGIILVVVGFFVLVLAFVLGFLGENVIHHYGNPPRAGYHQGQLVRYGESPLIPFKPANSCSYCGRNLPNGTVICSACGRKTR